MKAKKSRVILSGVSLLLVLCLLVGGTAGRRGEDGPRF